MSNINTLTGPIQSQYVCLVLFGSRYYTLWPLALLCDCIYLTLDIFICSCAVYCMTQIRA